MIQDKKALYYPYIHFRDIEWLKATLLCFPQVSRMAPSGLKWQSSEVADPFRNLTNEKGERLINEIYLDPWKDSPTYKVQERLLKKLVNNLDFLKSKYSRPITTQ